MQGALEITQPSHLLQAALINVRVHQIAHCIATSAEAREGAENGIMGSVGQRKLVPVSGSTFLGWLSPTVKLH